ncbi:hypothetical protein DSLASN_46660 [Desulfoluna limicola]|uniref:Uncharacterized protein n=1 Tax=Desulfoluna limicola TaxID=2810562 RepID=A0ABM7PNC3_9BACT|nr:hypothetical protein DSLASN_46660 [Desulfoluna limicola]
MKQAEWRLEDASMDGVAVPGVEVVGGTLVEAPICQKHIRWVNYTKPAMHCKYGRFRQSKARGGNHRRGLAFCG